MSKRIEQTNDHAFVPPDNRADECGYENCKMPECMHVWTVNASECNPRPATC